MQVLQVIEGPTSEQVLQKVIEVQSKVQVLALRE